MAGISDIHNPWRDSLLPASFRNALFHVETSTRAGGRRTVVHQYPKRNIPYAEDMGRDASRWSFTGYVIHGDHGFPGNILTQVAALNSALDADDAGLLQHPLLGTMLVMCERWSYRDQRERGGYFEYDMQFVEAGAPAMQAMGDAAGNLTSQAGAAENQGVASINSSTGVLAGGAPLGQGGIGHA